MRGRLGVEVVTRLLELFLIIDGGYPDLFYTNIRAAIKRPSVYVAESAECNWYLARERKSPRHLAGCREGHSKAAYLL